MVSRRRVVSLWGTFSVRLNRAHDALGVSGMVSGAVEGIELGGHMAYDPKELVELPAEIIALVAEVKAATAATSAGGTKITREERKQVFKAAARLVWVMVRDGLD